MWVLAGAFMVDSIDQNVVRGMVKQLHDAFNVSDLGIGVLMSAFILVNGLVTMPAGYLADRVFRTRLAAATIAAWSVASAGGAAAPSFSVLVGMRGILGFGQSVTDPSASSLLPDYYVTERRGRAYSIQQSMIFVGMGIGLAMGGAIAPRYGWRAAFVVTALPGLVVAALCWRLREPARGAADRMSAGIAESIEYVDPHAPREPILRGQSLGAFSRELLGTLVEDCRTLLAIRTLRFALAGVSALLFVVTAVGSWMPEFYIRNVGIAQSKATASFGLLAVVGGVPGVLLGGRLADRFLHRIEGARVVIPGICIIVSITFFLISMIRMPFAAVMAWQFAGLFSATLAIPALRAGLSDAVPAHLRGTGFSAFNLASVLFGSAAAPIVTSFASERFGGDLRTAFVTVMPVAYIGAVMLLRARKTVGPDTARLMERIVAANA